MGTFLRRRLVASKCGGRKVADKTADKGCSQQSVANLRHDNLLRVLVAHRATGQVDARIVLRASENCCDRHHLSGDSEYRISSAWTNPSLRAFSEKIESAGDSHAGADMIQASHWEEASLNCEGIFVRFSGPPGRGDRGVGGTPGAR